MKVSELIEILKDCNPDAEAIVCYKVLDGYGDYGLFMESELTCAEPYPGDYTQFLIHTTVTKEDVVRSYFIPQLAREFAQSLKEEADIVEKKDEERDYKFYVLGIEEYDRCHTSSLINKKEKEY